MPLHNILYYCQFESDNRIDCAKKTNILFYKSCIIQNDFRTLFSLFYIVIRAVFMNLSKTKRASSVPNFNPGIYDEFI